jgi:hypothetical protein
MKSNKYIYLFKLINYNNLSKSTKNTSIDTISIDDNNIENTLEQLYQIHCSGNINLCNNSSKAITTNFTGPTGQRGPIGQRGPTGQRGVQGIKGIATKTGATGAKGATGAIGKTGPIGINGNSTNTGATGPTGPTNNINFSNNNVSPGYTGYSFIDNYNIRNIITNDPNVILSLDNDNIKLNINPITLSASLSPWLITNIKITTYGTIPLLQNKIIEAYGIGSNNSTIDVLINNIKFGWHTLIINTIIAYNGNNFLPFYNGNINYNNTYGNLIIYFDKKIDTKLYFIFNCPSISNTTINNNINIIIY